MTFLIRNGDNNGCREYVHAEPTELTVVVKSEVRECRSEYYKVSC